MMRAFLVRAGEEIIIIPPTFNEITGTMGKTLTFFNSTGRGAYIAVGKNDMETYIALVTESGAGEISAIEEAEGYASDTVD